MVTLAQREAIRRAYRFQCGYCSVHENNVGSALEIDHFQLLSSGGTDAESNLIYAARPVIGRTWAKHKLDTGHAPYKKMLEEKEEE